jgi:uncharacterized protein HemX
MNPQTRSLDEDPTRPHHVDIPASYGLNPPARAWPTAARAALGAVIVALAAGLAVSLVMLRSVSATASKATREVTQLSRSMGQDTSQNGGSVAQLRSQLSAVQTQLGSISATIGHEGVCLRTWTDNNGHVSSVELVSPVISGNGNPACPAGVFVSVVPLPGG